MKARRIISVLIAILILLVPLGGISAESERTVFAETSEKINQGARGYCYVYIDDMSALASLCVDVYYDAETVEITGYYNSISCVMYDSSKGNGVLKYTYLFDGSGETGKTLLFYFVYKIKEDAPIGSGSFDIAVSDAYDSTRSPINVSGRRCAYEVTKAKEVIRCSVYATSRISTSVKEEYRITYRLSRYDIVSGAFEIKYDPEYFKLSGLTAGGMLSGKLIDVKTSQAGTASVSFAGSGTNGSNELITICFETKKNIEVDSPITFIAKDFYKADRELVVCGECKTNVTIHFDDEYTGDAPSMSLSSEADGKVLTLKVKLEANSHLGAGDFIISFDASKLVYRSSAKGFEPSYFSINDKKASEGVIKFSIISLSDITKGETVLTLSFDMNVGCKDQTSEIDISASGLCDSLTNKILLNMIGTNVTIAGGEHKTGDHLSDSKNHWQICTECGDKIGEDAHIDSDKNQSCDICGHAMLRIHSASLSLAENIDINYKAIVPDGFEDPYMVFEFNDKKTEVKEYTIDDNGRFIFVFPNVYPQMIGDNISATLYAYSTIDGEMASVSIPSFSARQYCINMLRTTSDETLKVLISDLLVYGEKTQIYRNYKTDALVSTGIDITPSKFETLDSSYNKFALEGSADPEIRYSSVALVLGSDITLKIGITCKDPSAYTFKVTIGNKKFTYTADDLYYDGKYYLDFNGIMAAQFDEPIVATIWRGDEQVSQTLTCSVNTYIAANQATDNEALRELIQAIFNYGRSAHAYKDKEG